MAFIDDNDIDDRADEGFGSAESFNPYAAFEAKYEGKTTLELVAAMADYGQQKDDLKDQLKGVNAEYDFLRLKAVPDAFERDNIENLKVAGIGRVSLTGDMYVSIVKSKTEEFFQWLRDKGSGSLIKETVAPSTLKASMKAWMKKGEAPTDLLVKVTPFTRASITKTK